MNVMDCIYKRRSIRKYMDKEVEKDTLEMLIRAAMAAPSAANRQPWEFIVVTDRDKMNELRASLFFGQYNAPAAIVVCGNMELAFANSGKEYWVQDCSAATENILLAALELGLGTVWIGVYPEPQKCKPVCTILNIPEHVIPLGVIYVGYPDEEREARTQYNEKRVYWQEYEPKRKHKTRPKDLKHQ